jgi:hypothetical protein
MSKAQTQAITMFAEIEGTGELGSRIGAREAEHAVERCLKRIERAIAGHGGRVVESTGHRLVAAFDAFEAADQAATEVQQRVEALPPVSGVKLTVRTGFDGAPPPRDAAKPERKTAAKAAAAAPKAAAEALHLCVRYRGQAFLLDDKATFLTLGRDPENQLVIADRKASREHARIEKHDHRYVFIDSSTNGSYVVIGDAAEVMVRRDRIDLAGSGRIFFGSSGSDPNADFAEYEYL